MYKAHARDRTGSNYLDKMPHEYKCLKSYFNVSAWSYSETSYFLIYLL